MTRRDFLLASAALPLLPVGRAKVRFGAITDVHHGLAPDSLMRLEAFRDAVAREHLDFVVQLGDFCHTWPPSEARSLLRVWSSIPHPKHHVLGNHDMDRGSKEDAMKLWGMPSRYGAFHAKGWRFLFLDLNNFRKGGVMVPYERGNYFTDGATHNLIDPEQLAWLRQELARPAPTILLAHQPLGIPDPNGKIPQEQLEVLDVIRGKVAGVLFGHLHVDRLERWNDIPCLCLNSASYFWQQGMHAYRDPLFAIIEISSGTMSIEGRSSEFISFAGAPEVPGCSASIADRRFALHSRN